MKIIQVNTYLLEKALSSTMRISRGGFTKRQHCLVEVITDEGITGLGEGVGNTRVIKVIIDNYLDSLVIGKDPNDIELMRKSLFDEHVYFERKGSVICAASAIEIACWDIKGKVLGLPVYELLGGKCKDKLPTYASDIYWQEEPNAMAESALRVVEAGYRNIKIHIGVRSPEEEIPRIAAVRKAIGNDIGLMVDLNAGYTLEQAQQASNIWSDYKLAWLEEPVDANDTDALISFTKYATTDVAAGENEFRVWGFKELLERQAVDVIMPDIARAGGILETIKICGLAEKYGIPVSPHNYSSGILLAATVHLMACTKNTTLLEIDTSDNSIYSDILTWKPIMDNGDLIVPTCPGLGVTLPAEVLKSYQVK